MAKSELKGFDIVSRHLANLVKNIPREVERALYTEAQIERTESMRRTPVDTGALRSTHAVSKPQTYFGVTAVMIYVGGPAAPYAIHVHENLTAQHKSGRAKFLESTLKESIPHMAARVARRINMNRAMQGGGG